jgi:hypothetical protein
MFVDNVRNAKSVCLVRWAQPVLDNSSPDRPETGAGDLEELKLSMCT